MQEPFISVIIPAYNESRVILKTLTKVSSFLTEKNLNFEILVVDDGSKDNTATIVESVGKNIRLISQIKNQGKGAAVRRGMLEAIGSIRIFTDADLSTPVYEIENVIEKLNSGYDVFIGSRALDSKRIKEHQPFYREMMGKTFNKIVQLFVFNGISDTQCGFKGFNDKSANKIFSIAKIDGFGFDVEILYLAKRFGLSIIEHPVDWFNDARSTVNPITDSINMIIEILKIKKIHKNL
ncbi:MAG: glycosyltransferase family 2 protein [Candidatus Kapabacteria bacterium]|nr:glycosyltransferase family 2 protein [Candidatus Kapabacteria bacterium]